MTLECDYSDASCPLELTVNVAGVGGLPGLVPTVAIRLSPTTDFYLDWTTNTFKNAGWGLKNKPMTDIGNGMYQVIFNVQALGFTPLSGLPQKVTAEYTTTGVGTSGLNAESIWISELRPDAKRARQYGTNRLETLAPGTMTLFEDDATTVQSVQTLTDATGGPVVDQPGAPQKRGPAPP